MYMYKVSLDLRPIVLLSYFYMYLLVSTCVSRLFLCDLDGSGVLYLCGLWCVTIRQPGGDAVRVRPVTISSA